MRTPRFPLLLLVTLGFGMIALAGCGDAAAPTAASATDEAPAASDAGDAAKATAEACGEADCDCCKEGASCEEDDCTCCKAKAAAAGGPACLCTQGKAGKPVWCKKCDKGYVDGEEAHCEGCVKTAQKKLEDSGE